MAASSSKSDAPSAEELEAQLKTLQADFAKLVESLGAAGSAKSDELKGKAADRAREALAAAEGRARRTEAEILGFVRDRPFAALGIAAGVGFLAPLLARR